jgi:hypothetical protein
MVAILDQEYSDCVMSGYNRINEIGENIGEHLDNEIHLGCALIKTKIINELKYRDDVKYEIGTKFLESLKAHCTINNIKDTLWNYREREGQLTQKEDHPNKRNK